MSFLPEDYEAPRMGNYMRLADGENKLRILSKPILGWVDWSLEKKPIRSRYSAKPPKAVIESKPPKHFWAFVVYNYSADKIQILEVTQATIRNDLEKISNDSDWGAPFFYDLKIIKSGQDTKTKYTVTPLPHKQISGAIKKAFEETPCCLEALFDNGNPFEAHLDHKPTPGIFGQDDLKKPSAFEVSQKGQLDELRECVLLEGLPLDPLHDYLSLKAREKNAQLDQVVSSALVKEMLPRFMKVYRKWLEETHRLEEAIPF